MSLIDRLAKSEIPRHEESVKLRRQARVIALQALYEIDCTGHKPELVVQELVENESVPAEGADFAAALVLGVLQCVKQLDAIITKHAPEWPVDQLALVDRNVLRIALYELQHNDDVPIKVAVNEAIELAKTFGSDTAARFVNGVLGAFLVEHPAGELRH
jgi:transcription antitermination protein NusB